MIFDAFIIKASVPTGIFYGPCHARALTLAACSNQGAPNEQELQ